MKIVVACAVIFFANGVGAETIIIEYPDHYYVESTGVPGAKPAPDPDKTSPLMTAPGKAEKEPAYPTKTSPVTNFVPQPRPAEPSERRASMDDAIQRLQFERSVLLTPTRGETLDQVEQRQLEATGILRRINRISSEILKMP